MKTTEYPCSVLEEKVNSVDVSIIGVAHDYDFFAKHEHFFEEKIAQSDAVMLESGSVSCWQDHNFFRHIGAIAYSLEKKIYQADPRNKLIEKQDATQAALGVLGVCLALFTSFLSPEYTIPAGLYLFSGSFIGTIFRYAPQVYFSKNKLPKFRNSYEILSYGGIDYADVTIAEGINKISSEVKDVKKLACFHGDAHSKPIKTYIKHPSFRKFKRLLYKPTYELFAKTKVREYTPTNHGFELTRKF